MFKNVQSFWCLSVIVYLIHSILGVQTLAILYLFLQKVKNMYPSFVLQKCLCSCVLHGCGPLYKKGKTSWLTSKYNYMCPVLRNGPQSSQQSNRYRYRIFYCYLGNLFTWIHEVLVMNDQAMQIFSYLSSKDVFFFQAFLTKSYIRLTMLTLQSCSSIFIQR